MIIPIGGTDNPADIFTKPLPKASFRKIQHVLGVMLTQQGSGTVKTLEGPEEPEEEQLPDHTSWTTMERQSIAAFQRSLLPETEEEWESIDRPRTTTDKTQDTPSICSGQVIGTSTRANKGPGIMRSRPTPTSSGEVEIGNVTTAWRAWPRLSS